MSCAIGSSRTCRWSSSRWAISPSRLPVRRARSVGSAPARTGDRWFPGRAPRPHPGRRTERGRARPRPACLSRSLPVAGRAARGAGHLVNGSSITRGEAVADLTYWHVELDTHDLLLAENAPAESFLARPACAAASMACRPSTSAPAHALRSARRTRPRLGRAARALSPPRCLVGRCGRAGLGASVAGPMRRDGRWPAARRGWARDEAHPDTPLCLDVLVDGAVVAFAVAAEFRSDLAAAGFGDGRCGFDLGVHVRLAPHVHHRVEVRRSADGLLMCAKRMDAAGSWIALLAA